MVSAFRRRKSLRKVAAQFGVAPGTVRYWVQRAAGRRFDRIDWEDRSRAPKCTQRTSAALERKVLTIRRRLKKRSALGEHGAVAIHRELHAKEATPCPSVRTIGRILQRNGVLDGRKRVRRPPPLRGWYLPEVAAENAELDSFDTIEGLAIRGGPHLTVLTGISLHGVLPVVWPERSLSSRSIVELLVEHWRKVGLPGYAQFDNDNRFCGPKQYADVVGRVSRLCLSLRVTPPCLCLPTKWAFRRPSRASTAAGRPVSGLDSSIAFSAVSEAAPTSTSPPPGRRLQRESKRLPGGDRSPNAGG